MSKLLIACIIVVALLYSLYFFYRASGTLNPGKLHIIQLTGLLFFLQTFVGTALIMLGLDRHYTLDKLADRAGTMQITFFVVMAFAVAFPLLLWLFLRLLRVDPRTDYARYLAETDVCRPRPVLFVLMAAAAAVCIALMALYFKRIGYVPLWRLFFHDAAFDTGLERNRISGLYIIHPYVTSIGIHLAIPLLAYFSFACALSEKKLKWYALAGVLLIAAGLVKTYNFAKSPVIPFLLVYLCIYIYHRGGIKTRWLVLFGAFSLVVLVAAYVLQGSRLNMMDIYNGIWGRTFFTQVGTLSYNFELFPTYLPFLRGRSFNRIIMLLLHLPYGQQVRSARILMEFYGSEGVFNGTAGVMNSLFIGEAYANFGWIGLAVSVVWVAFFIAVIFAVVVKTRKSPAMVTLFAFFTVNAAFTTQGGFVDFVYNISWIITFAAMVICHRLLFFRDRAAKTSAGVEE
ncbi:MAG: oligosaccharide repeat unit polymerase [Oscillospiraceae bacterium]|nr:oligosaccharide repeat unit polymerase [Oscillospiraceae bacterium]